MMVSRATCICLSLSLSPLSDNATLTGGSPPLFSSCKGPASDRASNAIPSQAPILFRFVQTFGFVCHPLCLCFP
ncbi:hypothetical protein F4780DRAFT_356517 [Xylariomycetidae sp. FL0641]|nr:hypothetical protein F4780DRAFT_356517 [Xylariomycetidae sp. FL0641]